MYIPLGEILTIRGEVFDDTLVDLDTGVKLPTKQKIQTKKSGYIKFIRNGDGVCDILQIVDYDFTWGEEEISLLIFLLKWIIMEDREIAGALGCLFWVIIGVLSIILFYGTAR